MAWINCVNYINESINCKIMYISLKKFDFKYLFKCNFCPNNTFILHDISFHNITFHGFGVASNLRPLTFQPITCHLSPSRLNNRKLAN